MSNVPDLDLGKSWRSRADFPSVQPNEDIAREDMQCLFDVIRDYINNNLVPNANAAKVIGLAVNGDDELVVTMSDGTERNLGKVGGDKGSQPTTDYINDSNMSTPASSYSVHQVYRLAKSAQDVANKKVALPLNATGSAVDNGRRGQLAVSDGSGGIQWKSAGGCLSIPGEPVFNVRSTYTYYADEFKLGIGGALVADQDASRGTAIRLAALDQYDPSDLQLTSGESHPVLVRPNAVEIGSLTYDALAANLNKGYKAYEFKNVVLPSDLAQVYMFNWRVQNVAITALAGQTVDLTIYLKVEGTDLATDPVYFVDRMVAAAPSDKFAGISSPVCHASKLGDVFCFSGELSISEAGYCVDVAFDIGDVGISLFLSSPAFPCWAQVGDGEKPVVARWKMTKDTLTVSLDSASGFAQGDHVQFSGSCVA